MPLLLCGRRARQHTVAYSTDTARPLPSKPQQDEPVRKPTDSDALGPTAMYLRSCLISAASSRHASAPRSSTSTLRCVPRPPLQLPPTAYTQPPAAVRQGATA